MTERPTPMVDALFEEFINASGEKDVIDYHAIMRKLDLLARQLERELSEAREKLEEALRLPCTDAREQKMGCFRAVNAELRAEAAEQKLERRDAAIAAFIKRHDELLPALNDVFKFYAIHGMKWPEDKHWKAELDALRKELG